MKIDRTLNITRGNFLHNANTDFIFFSFIFLIQFIFIFQGIDLADEGYLTTLYTNIFNNPKSVNLTFLFWLTGIIGGTFDKFIPELGLWGFRLLGILTITFTAIVTYRLLRDYLDKNILKVSLIFVVLTHNNSAISINYNTISLLFYLLMVSALFNGLKENNHFKLFLSGIFLTLGIFSRISNIMELAIIPTIFIYNAYNNKKLFYSLKQLIYLLSGLCLSAAIIFIFMYLVGHLEVFFEVFGVALNMAKSTSHPEKSTNFYGYLVLIEHFISNYTYVFKAIAIFIAVSFLIIYLFRLINYLKPNSNIFSKTLKYIIIFFVGVLLFKDFINVFSILFLYAGLIVLFSILVIMSNESIELKFLSVMGLFLLLFFPFTSSAGITTAGRFSFWIGLPISLNYFSRINNLLFNLNIKSKPNDLNINIRFTEFELKPLKQIFFVSLFLIGFYHSYYYPYFDKYDRFYMRYSVNNKYLKNIYTTEGRANVLNDLLEGSKKFVKPGDYVLAYDRIPMYYYLTETNPFIGNPLVFIYNPNDFKEALNSNVKSKGYYPIIVQQKISTFLNNKSWPYNMEENNYFSMVDNQDRNKFLDDFIRENGYTKVWDNNYFMILTPPGLK